MLRRLLITATILLFLMPVVPGCSGGSGTTKSGTNAITPVTGLMTPEPKPGGGGGAKPG
jgi:hypothetical protein